MAPSCLRSLQILTLQEARGQPAARRHGYSFCIGQCWLSDGQCSHWTDLGGGPISVPVSTWLSQSPSQPQFAHP